ncbi:DUF3987 domain-containing protein [bacterium]|nr:DUF3987 domain-containing protein [bacterium]
MPEILKECLGFFNDDTSKEIALQASITALSGLFPSYSSIYDGHRVHCNLYSFIIGHAGCGKSAMKIGEYLVVKVQEHRVKKSTSVDADIKGSKNINKMYIVPGDASSAGLMRTLQANPEGLLLCETEGDTISNNLAKEYGDHSTILRCAAHHETVKRLRSTDNEYFEVQEPKLSILTSGTPGQVKRLTKSIEDGLFSRFMYYMIQNEPSWRDPYNKTSHSMKELLQDKAEVVFDYYKHVNQAKYTFRLESNHKSIINNTGKDWFEDAKQYGPHAIAIATRMGLNLHRITMLLSLLYHLEDGLADKEVVCYDDALSAALEICNTLFNNALKLICDSGGIEISVLSDNLSQFYSALNEEYTIPSDRNAAARKLGFCEKTGRNIHKKLVEKGLVKPTGTAKRWRKVKTAPT